MKDPDLAVALGYDPGRASPASSPGVAIRREQNLAALLSTLEVDCPIPVAAFAAIAEILGHLYRANRELQDARR